MDTQKNDPKILKLWTDLDIILARLVDLEVSKQAVFKEYTVEAEACMKQNSEYEAMVREKVETIKAYVELPKRALKEGSRKMYEDLVDSNQPMGMTAEGLSIAVKETVAFYDKTCKCAKDPSSQSRP